MDSDFINEYVDRLNKSSHDLISKNVVLETRAVVAEKKLAAAQEEINSLTEQLHQVISERDVSVNEKETLRTELSTVRNDNDRLINENAIIKQNINTIQAMYDGVKVELEALTLKQQSRKKPAEVVDAE